MAMIEFGGRGLNPRDFTRKLIRWTAIGIGALVVTSALGSFALHTYGAYRLDRARTDFSASWGHLALSRPAAPVPDDENGARWLVAGGDAIVCSDEDRRFYGQLSDRPAAEWTDAERSRARWILHEQQNALGILLRSGTCETFNLGSDGLRPSYETVEFSSIVMGVRLLVLEARLAWSEGRTADALAALDAAGRSADGLLQTPIVMVSTIGSAADRWVAAVATAIVSDPSASAATLRNLRAILPSVDPVQSTNMTFAISIAELADEGFQYIEESFDPSMGWAVPFWISNHYLLEDLYLAEVLEGWRRFLEIGKTPAALWSPDAIREIWEDPSWPQWLAMTGAYTPNLLPATARAQAASTELQQLELAIELRLASPGGLGPDACELISETRPTALTGEPIDCRFDDIRCLIVIEAPGAEHALSPFVPPQSKAAQIRPIEIPVTLGGTGCE